MKLTIPCVGTVLLLPLLCAAWLSNSSQAKSKERTAGTSTSIESAGSNNERKNPVKPTPENLAEAKKFFGYDCAMCHGAAGDGKGDLAAPMGLKMNDWRDSSKLADLSDGEMFDLIVKGKGKNDRRRGSLSGRNGLGAGELCAGVREEGHRRDPRSRFFALKDSVSSPVLFRRQ
jgi:cytochrome c5